MNTSRKQCVAAMSAAVLAALAGKASGQVYTWNNAAASAWHTAGNWTPAGVPSLATDTAIFAPTGWTHTVNLGMPTVVGRVEIQNAGTTLAMNGQTLTLAGPAGLVNDGFVFVQGASNVIDGAIANHAAEPLGVQVRWGGTLTLGAGALTNDGAIVVNPSGSNATSWITFASDRTIDGTGSIRLGANTTRSALYSADGVTVTQGPGHTIEGGGHVAAALANQGTIDANAASPLILLTRDKSNEGVMRASTGSTLQIDGVTVSQAPAGLILADGGTVSLTGAAAVVGGVVESANGGTVVHSGATTLNGVTSLAAMDLTWTSSLTVANGLLNDGVLRVNPSGGNGTTTLHFGNDGDLHGTGELWLGYNASRSQVTAEPGVTITHGADHLIHGAGYFNAALVNNGVVAADRSGNALELRVNPKVNNAAMIATGGGILDLSTQLTQGGAGLVLADGGTVRLSNGAHVIGGELAADNGGRVFATGGTSRLTSVHNSGAFDLDWVTTLAVDGAGLTNDGVLRVNPGSSNGVTTLRFDASGDLDGAGEIVLGASTDRAQITGADGVVIAHGADHTVRGSGQITVSMVNNGLISAEGPGHPLILNGAPKVNNNLMRAAGHQLHIGCEIDQASGARIVAETGQVRLYHGTSIAGGELAADEGALVVLHSGNAATLAGVRTAGPFDIEWVGTLTVMGGLENDGLIRVNPTASNGTTTLHFGESQQLGGTGEVRLNAYADRAQITGAPGAVVTQGAGHTIRGSGQVSAALVNNGTVEALGGNPLILNGEGKVNNAVMRTAADSFLSIAAPIEQGPGGQIVADDGEVRLSTGATISGGSLASVGGGRVVVDAGGTVTLDGVSFSGSMPVEWVSNLTIGPGGLTNDGEIVVNASASNGTTTVWAGGETSLSGTGELILNDANTRSRIVGQKGARLTHGPDHTIRGSGNIHTALTNHGRLAPGKSGAPVGEFNLSGDVQLGASSRVELDVSGPTGYDRFTGDAAIALDGRLEAKLVPPYEPALNAVFTIIAAGEVTGAFSEVVLPEPLDDRLEWRITYAPAQVTLAVRCRADANGDGALTVADFSVFRSAYLAGEAWADFNGDGALSVADFSAFRTAYLAGCQ